MTTTTLAEHLPLGTPVLAWAGTRDDAPRWTKTRSEPWQLGHGAWVVQVEGIAGGIALSHIERIPEGWVSPEQHRAAVEDAERTGYCNGIAWADQQKVEVMVKALDDKVARVEALAPRWEQYRDGLRARSKASSMDRREANTWDVAVHELRAAMTLPEAATEPVGSKA